MDIKYVGKGKEGHEMAEKLKKAMSRPQIMSMSNNPDDWPICKKCGEHMKSVYEDTGLCISCDSK